MNNQEYDQHIINFHTQLLLKILSTKSEDVQSVSNVPFLMNQFVKSFNETVAKSFLDQKFSQTTKLAYFDDYPEQFLIHSDVELSKFKNQLIKNKSDNIYSQLKSIDETLNGVNFNKLEINPNIVEHAINDAKKDTQVIINNVVQLFKEIAEHYKGSDKLNKLYEASSSFSFISTNSPELKTIKESLDISMEKILANSLEKIKDSEHYDEISKSVNATFSSYSSSEYRLRR